PDANREGTGSRVLNLEPIADTRPSVAVLYFDNLSGDDSLDWLRSGLTDLLVTDLSQSPELRILTTDVLYEILEETDNLDERVTSAALVREVAERANVDNVVVGSFIRAGDTFRVSVRLQQPATGETLTADTAEGVGEDSVFASIDRLTERIKERLAVPVVTDPVVDRDLSEVTTSSMEAYRYYVEGVNLIDRNRSEEAIPHLERALEIDPEFAMAFAKMSIAYSNMRDFDEERVWSEKAIAQADRLTARERYYIEGRYYSQDATTRQQSIEAYQAALAVYPDDTASRNNLAGEYMELEQFDKAITQYEEVLRRGTTFLPAYTNTASAYVSNGECDKAVALMQDLIRSQPEYHFAYQRLASNAMRCGRLDEAQAALDTYWESRRAGAPRDPADGLMLAYLHMLRDEFSLAGDAAEILADSPSPLVRLFAYPGINMFLSVYQGQGSNSSEPVVEAAESIEAASADLRALVYSGLARVTLSAGDVDAALEAVEAARQTSPTIETDAGLAALSAIAHARAGQIVAARTAAGEYERISAQLPGPATERMRLLVAAELALANGDTDAALQNLQDAVELLPPGPSVPVQDEFVRYAFPLAWTHLQRGEFVDAAELFERIVECGPQRLHYPYEYVRSFYFLAKIAEQNGDTRTARRHYQRFLDYWGNGDIDPERVAEARKFVEDS
ncbi:MAG: tetratricopeptide repeat protein, partial [Acidobacteriota bacterium]